MKIFKHLEFLLTLLEPRVYHGAPFTFSANQDIKIPPILPFLHILPPHPVIFRMSITG
jgi:hypothetical protein